MLLVTVKPNQSLKIKFDDTPELWAYFILNTFKEKQSDRESVKKETGGRKSYFNKKKMKMKTLKECFGGECGRRMNK